MIRNEFFRFFIFCLVICTALGVVIFLLAAILKIRVPVIDILLFIGFCLFYSLGMGAFGNLYAKNTCIYVDSVEYAENKLVGTKYVKSLEENDKCIYATDKYREWFYGSIIVEKIDGKTKVQAANCVINKYFY